MRSGRDIYFTLEGMSGIVFIAFVLFGVMERNRARIVIHAAFPLSRPPTLRGLYDLIVWRDILNIIRWFQWSAKCSQSKPEMYEVVKEAPVASSCIFNSSVMMAFLPLRLLSDYSNSFSRAAFWLRGGCMGFVFQYM